MMHPVEALSRKKERLIIGLMSGTSVDGIDAALVRISGHGDQMRLRQEGFLCMPFLEEVRTEILRLAGGGQAAAADFCRMNALLGHLYVRAADALCKKAGVSREEIDLIGSHGQTLWHIPEEEAVFGIPMRSTFQSGEAAVLAEAFSCAVYSDFRVRDIAAGGQGAPLVPFSEYLIYRSEDKNIALQNIGGIGNITCLKKGCRPDEVYAFDTGPGNMVIDAVVSHLTGGKERYDEGGLKAAEGTVNKALLALLMEDPYLQQAPPKTTGREYYGPSFLADLLQKAEGMGVRENDLVATVTSFTAESIAYSVRQYIRPKPDCLIIGGGGSRNRTLLHMLQEALPETRVQTNEDIGFDSEAKEAVAFAVLANEALFASCNNVPHVTGAAHPVVMGKLSL